MLKKVDINYKIYMDIIKGGDFVKILLVNGQSFMGTGIAERFFKEGYDIFLLDESNNDNLDLKIKHKTYNLNIKDNRCEEIFSANCFNYVIYIGNSFIGEGASEDNTGKVRRALELSSKYKVDKFFYISSLQVYEGLRGTGINEDTEIENTSLQQMNILSDERDCRYWNESTELKVRVLRVGEPYGPNHGFSTLNNVIEETVNSNGTITSVSRENIFNNYIHIGDLADGVFKAAEFSTSFIINLCSEEAYEQNDVRKLIASIYKGESQKGKTQGSNNKDENTYSIDRAKKELNWRPKYSLEEGIEKTISWMKNNPKKKTKLIEEYSNKNKFKRLIPYIENILCFLLIMVLDMIMKRYNITPIIDLSLIYISVMAIIYGLSQSWISILLSSILFIAYSIGNGQSIISLIYNPNTLLNISLYIFVGAVLGYILDSNKAEIKEKNIEIANHEEKFDFIYGLYTEMKEAKFELEDQIISTEDSFGKINKITSELNSLNVELIYDKTIGVIKQVMKVESVALFTVSKDDKYLRLISSSNDLKNLGKRVKSISVEESPEIRKIINEKTTFINSGFNKELPSMMVPIILEEKVIAAIAIYEVKFEELNLYKENLFNVLGSLVTSAIVRAYQYEQAIADSKYIKGTEILNYSYFKELLINKENIMETSNIDSTLLQVHTTGFGVKGIYGDIKKLLRDIDFIGVDERRNLYVLLNNTSEEEAEFVINRLKRKNIKTSIASISRVVNSENNHNMANAAEQEVAATLVDYKEI